MVPGNTHFRGPVKGEVLLSPTKGFVEKHKVLVEAQPLKVVPLHIFNPGNTAITIKKGAVAGVLQPVKVLPSANPARLEQTVRSSPIIPQHLQELYAQSSTELNAEEQHQLEQLLSTYGSVFSTDPNDLGHTSLVQHDIITRPGAPVKQPPRRMAWDKQQSADQQI